MNGKLQVIRPFVCGIVLLLLILFSAASWW